MSIDIFVQRGPGDKRGEDIVDPLITDINVAIQRGRNELDEQASAMQDVEVQTLYRTGLRIGQLARFLDIQQSVVWLGKITGITHRIEGGETITNLQVKRPTVFYTG